MPCPTDSALQEFAAGSGARDMREDIDRHLSSCESCRRAVAMLAMQSEIDAGKTNPSGPRALERAAADTSGEQLGRYVLLERVGAGGMGQVYAAWDPKLARRVAVKLLLPERAHDANARARFLREAQAMAQLSHPNVITVHEVGETPHGEVFIAMEFVEGETLSRWLSAATRSLEERLEVMKAAGAGLAAAHRAGLVHRDFKPDNVLVAPGVVRVTDFGLARGVAEAPAPNSAPVPDAPAGLTGTGFLLGTPAYMAPEQWRNEVDARSDQFSFCVTLAEVLSGRRPFEGASTLEALREAAAKGLVSVPGAPRWLEAVVTKGGSADPARRFESMDALLAALAKDPRRTRRQALRLGGLGLALAVLVALVTVGAQRRLSQCAQAADLGSVWDAPARTALHAGLTASGRDFAQVVASRVEANLEAWVTQWQAASTQTCQARARGELTEAQAEQRGACLDQRRRELGALVRLLAHADERVVLRAVQASEHLGDVAACTDAAAVRSERPLPADPVARARVLHARDTLADVFAESEAGHYREALAAAKVADEEVVALDYKALRAESLLRVGQLQHFLSELDDAAKALHAAALTAEATGQDRLAAKARLVLAQVLSEQGGHQDELEQFLEMARANIERAGMPEESVEALEDTVARVRYAQARWADAEAAFRRSLALLQRLDGTEHARVGTSWNGLGAVLSAKGTPREALAAYAEAERIWTKTLGPEHPNVATNLNDQAITLSELGEHERAAACNQRALEIRTHAYGPDSVEVAQSLANIAADLPRAETAKALELYERALAIFTKRSLDSQRAWVLDNIALVFSRSGKPAEAKAKHREALALFERLEGPEGEHVGRSLHNLASLLADTGELEEAIPLFERAMRIHEKLFGPESALVGYGLSALGDAAYAKKDWAKADDWFERAKVLFEKATPPNQGMLMYTLTLLADVRHRRKQPGAVDLVTRALSVLDEVHDPDPRQTGRTRAVAAELLWEKPAQRSRAHALGVAALADLKQGHAPEADITSLERWLAVH